VCAVVVFIVCW